MAKILPSEGAVVRISLYDGLTWIAINPSGVPVDPRVVPRGELSCRITHEASMSWPDAEGVATANEVIRGGGTVVAIFATLADGLRFRRRLKGGAS